MFKNLIPQILLPLPREIPSFGQRPPRKLQEYVPCEPLGHIIYSLIETPYFTDPDWQPQYATHYAFNECIQESMLYAREICPAICTGTGVVPVRNLGNDKASVEYRLNRVRNRRQFGRWGFKMKRRFTRWIVDNHLKEIHSWSAEEVIDHMPKRSRATAIAKHYDYSIYECMEIIGTFIKEEAYAKFSDPRNISPVDDKHLVESSRFTYPFSAMMHVASEHTIPWYMPGKAPAMIAAQVAEVTADGAYFGADYSRFDGTQNRHLRSIILDVMCDLLPVGDATDLRVCFNSELRGRGRTTFGIEYSIEGTMTSGSAFTTLGNTLTNAFIYFCAVYTHLSKDGHVPTDDEITALMNMCALYGDDSLGPKCIERAFFDVCKRVGLSATSEDCSKGATFLGRIYPFDGRTHSFQDPSRVFPKFHISTARSYVPLGEAACNRARGYLSLCPDEPWIADYCKAILRIYGNVSSKYATNSEAYMADMLSKGPFPFDMAELDATAGIVSDILNTTPMVMDECLSLVRKARCLGDFPTGWIETKTLTLAGKYGDESLSVYESESKQILILEVEENDYKPPPNPNPFLSSYFGHTYPDLICGQSSQ